MLNSKSNRFQNGFGNDSGELGHNLMDHHFKIGATGTWEGDEDKYYIGRRPNGIYIPRYRNIGNDKRDYAAMSPLDVAVRHDKTLGYIKHIVQEHKDKKCVVVGHHSPSFKSCHPSYAHETLMNGGYHSDLSEFIIEHPQIKLWTHGHTHHPFDYVIGETRVVCNPRGYANDGYSEDTGWDPTKILEI
jgi:hypothetical protein